MYSVKKRNGKVVKFELVRIADAIKDESPNVMIDTFAYYYTLDVPKTLKAIIPTPMMIIPRPTFRPNGMRSSSDTRLRWYSCRVEILPFLLEIPRATQIMPTRKLTTNPNITSPPLFQYTFFLSLSQLMVVPT